MKTICWFSCGAASAVATKLAIEKYGHVEIYYTDTGIEHDDNPRFIADCEKWFGQKVNILKNPNYKDAIEVCEKRRYLSGHAGAPCTGAMKKEPANGIWNLGDIEVFGYTLDEKHRLERWKKNNDERNIECPLIDKHLTKEDCLGMLDRVGIEIPAMYKLGFRNNNCIGCVKATSVDYWKRIRKHFPNHFERVAKLEKEIGYNIIRITKNGKRVEVPLYELPPGDPTGADPKISCGLFCMTETDNFK